jgi:hypothetical protein
MYISSGWVQRVLPVLPALLSGAAAGQAGQAQAGISAAALPAAS